MSEKESSLHHQRIISGNRFQVLAPMEEDKDDVVLENLQVKLDGIPEIKRTIQPGTGLNIPLQYPLVNIANGSVSTDQNHLWKLAAAHGMVKDIAKFMVVSSIWLKQLMDFSMDVLKRTPASTLVVESKATDQGLGFEFFTPGKFTNSSNQSRFSIWN